MIQDQDVVADFVKLKLQECFSDYHTEVPQDFFVNQIRGIIESFAPNNADQLLRLKEELQNNIGKYHRVLPFPINECCELIDGMDVSDMINKRSAYQHNDLDFKTKSLALDSKSIELGDDESKSSFFEKNGKQLSSSLLSFDPQVLKIHKILPDGNCFYASVCHQLRLKKVRNPDTNEYYTHQQLRKIALDYSMSNDRDYIEELLGAQQGLSKENIELLNRGTGSVFKDYDEYSSYHMQDKKWADSGMIGALAKALEITIQIRKDDRYDRQIVPINAGKDVVVNIRHTGSHYDSLIPAGKSVQGAFDENKGLSIKEEILSFDRKINSEDLWGSITAQSKKIKQLSKDVSYQDLSSFLQLLYANNSTIPPLISDMAEHPLEDHYVKLQMIMKDFDSSGAVGEKIEIAEEQLFEPVGKDYPASNKLIITGGAGVGKSTLLQYLAYKWSTSELWGGRFDYVFRIKLKHLLTIDWSVGYEYSDLTSFIHFCIDHKIVRSRKHKKQSLEDIQEALEGNRVLLLADGLDEVLHLKSSANKALRSIYQDVMDEILEQQHFIMTSRPNVLHQNKDILERVDRQIETTGLDAQGIEQYLDNTFSDNELAESLLDFINKHHAIKQMCNIPMNIAILSTIWRSEEIKQKFIDTDKISLNLLYDEMMVWLGRRYLEKKGENVDKGLEKTHIFSQNLMQFLVEVAYNAFTDKSEKLAVTKNNIEGAIHYQKISLRQDVHKHGLLLPEGESATSYDVRIVQKDEEKVMNGNSTASMELGNPVLIVNEEFIPEELIISVGKQTIRSEFDPDEVLLDASALSKITNAIENILNSGGDILEIDSLSALGERIDTIYQANKIHYFAHLTFEEYLVAYYLNKELQQDYLESKFGIKEDKNILEFLANERNNPRYLNMLKFLTGMVSDDVVTEVRGANVAIERFWDAMLCNIDGSLELGNEGKTILLMHLLSSTNEEAFEYLEDDHWIGQQIEKAKDFVDTVVLKDIGRWADHIRDSGYISNAMAERIRNIILGNDNIVPDVLDNKIGIDSDIEEKEFIIKQSNKLLQRMLNLYGDVPSIIEIDPEELMGRLLNFCDPNYAAEGNNWRVSREAIAVIVKTFKESLKKELLLDSDIDKLNSNITQLIFQVESKQYALAALIEISKVDKKFGSDAISKIRDLLDKEGKSISKEVAETIKKIALEVSSLASDIFDVLTAVVSMGDLRSSKIAIGSISEILHNQPKELIEKGFDLLFNILRSQSAEVPYAAEAISKIVVGNPEFAERGIDGLIRCLPHIITEMSTVTKSISNIAKNFPDLAERTLDPLINLLAKGNTHPSIAVAITHILEVSPYLAERALYSFINLLVEGSTRSILTRTINYILEASPDLGECTPDALINLLADNDTNTDTVIAISNIAKNFPELAERTPDALINLLADDDTNTDTVIAISNIAKNFPELAEGTLDALINLSAEGGTSRDVAMAISDIAKNFPELAEGTLDALINLLADDDTNTNTAIAIYSIAKNAPELAERALDALIAHGRDAHAIYSIAKNAPELAERALDALIAHGRDAHAIYSIAKNAPELAERALDALIKRADDLPIDQRRKIIENIVNIVSESSALLSHRVSRMLIEQLVLERKDVLSAALGMGNIMSTLDRSGIYDIVHDFYESQVKKIDARDLMEEALIDYTVDFAIPDFLPYIDTLCSKLLEGHITFAGPISRIASTSREAGVHVVKIFLDLLPTLGNSRGSLSFILKAIGKIAASSTPELVNHDNSVVRDASIKSVTEILKDTDKSKSITKSYEGALYLMHVIESRNLNSLDNFNEIEMVKAAMRLLNKLVTKFDDDVSIKWANQNLANLSSISQYGGAFLFKKICKKILSQGTINEFTKELIINCIIDIGITFSINRDGAIIFEGVRYDLENGSELYLDQIAQVILRQTDLANNDDLLSEQYVTYNPLFENHDVGMMIASSDIKNVTSIINDSVELKFNSWNISLMHLSDDGKNIPTEIFLFIEGRNAFGQLVNYKLSSSGIISRFVGHPERFNEEYKIRIFGNMEYGATVKPRYYATNLEIDIDRMQEVLACYEQVSFKEDNLESVRREFAIFLERIIKDDLGAQTSWQDYVINALELGKKELLPGIYSKRGSLMAGTLFQQQTALEDMDEKITMHTEITNKLQKALGLIEANQKISEKKKARMQSQIESINEKIQTLARQEDIETVTEAVSKLISEGKITRGRLEDLEDDLDELIERQDILEDQFSALRLYLDKNMIQLESMINSNNDLSDKKKARMQSQIESINEKIQTLARQEDIETVTEAVSKLISEGKITRGRLEDLEDDLDELIDDSEQIVNMLTTIEFDNILLNYPELFNAAAKKFDVDTAFVLGSNLSQEDIVWLLSGNNPSAALIGLAETNIDFI